MEFIVVFACTVLAAFALRNPIKRCPPIFCGIALIAVVLMFLGASGYLGEWWRALVAPVQRCMVALALFTVVMFIGVLPKESKAAHWLRPVRGELSIIACILCMGHMGTYLAPYATRALSGALDANVLASFAVSLVLLVLLVILGFTSFNVVKRRMSASSWKSVQRLAYPFFILVYVHLLFMLVPAAARGGEQAMLSMIVYSLIFVSYMVLRGIRWAKDRRTAPEAVATAAATQG